MTLRERAARYQDGLERSVRRATGTFYTPAGLVDCVLDLSLEPLLDEVAARADGPDDLHRRLLALRVCDPTCGAGLLLAAAAERIAARGAAYDEVVSRCLFGVDLDPAAIDLARELLPGADLRVGDALIGAPLEVADRASAEAWCAGHGVSAPFHWRLELPEVFAAGGFDLVVGNPPFLNRLTRQAADSRARAALVRSLLGGSGAYTDVSALVLRRSLDLVREGGRVAMVQPVSLLAARDAAPVRRHLASQSALTGIWASRTPVFPDASVLTCAVSLVRGREQGEVEVRCGAAYASGGVVPAPDLDGAWSPLLAAAFGVPVPELATRGALADLGEVTADFRDEYYGLEPFVTDSGEGFALVTTGLIDPGRNLWGERPARFLRRTWQRPTIDPAVLDSPLGDWARRRLVPKVLIGTQGRIIEAVVDEAGDCLPCVPVITMTTDRPWHVLAVLLAPPMVARCAAQYAGTGLGWDSIKLSARQVAALPLPAATAHWDRAAALARSGDLAGAAAAMLPAYGVADETLLDWWRDRIPQRVASRMFSSCE